MLKVIDLYISQNEQTELLRLFKRRPISSSKGRNSIIRYGSSLPYGYHTRPIPPHFDFLLERLRDDSIIDADHITINEYHPSQSIDWHIDSPTSGPKIVVLSLLSEATMMLRDKKSHETRRIVILPPLSLLIMDDIERWQWEHSIQPLDAHRYSIVFRKGTPIINP